MNVEYVLIVIVQEALALLKNSGDTITLALVQNPDGEQVYARWKKILIMYSLFY